jgi:MFS family permease
VFLRRIAEAIGVNRVVVALSMARLGDALGNSILFIVIPLYVSALASPAFPFPESVRVGLLIALYGLVNSFLQPFTGALADRLKRRKPLIQAGLGMMGAGTLLFIVANRFVDLLLLRILQGVGVALTVPASMAVMTTASEKSTRGGSMGVYTSLRLVGLASGPLIGGALYDRFGFDAAFYAGAALILLGMALVQLWVKEVEGSGSDGRPFKLFDRDIWTPGAIGLGFATFVMAGAFSMITTLETQFNERLNQTAFAFGVAFSALMVSRFVFQLPLGRLSDRIGRKPLIIAGLIVMAPATALLGLVVTTLQLAGLRVLQGLGSAGVAAPAFALAGDLSRAGGEGRQMSIVTIGFGLGIALGPLIAGLLAVVTFELPFIIGGALTLLGAWVVYQFVPETVQRQRD